MCTKLALKTAEATAQAKAKSKTKAETRAEAKTNAYRNDRRQSRTLTALPPWRSRPHTHSPSPSLPPARPPHSTQASGHCPHDFYCNVLFIILTTALCCGPCLPLQGAPNSAIPVRQAQALAWGAPLGPSGRARASHPNTAREFHPPGGALSVVAGGGCISCHASLLLLCCFL